ncbi:NepR family anti-sigma factor [Methylocystis sp. S23]
MYSPSDLGGSRGAPAHGARKTYDDLAGSALLRRSGKNAAGGAPLRGDQAATLLAARRKNEGDDRIGRELRDFYQTMLREPVPERFVALVDALEAQGR